MIRGERVVLHASVEEATFASSNLVVRVDGTAVGTCGLRDGSPEYRRATAYVDVPEQHRADALRTLCRWAFDMVNLAKVEAYVREDDLPMYEGLGFAREVHRRDAVWDGGGWHDEHLVGVFPEELR